MKIKKDKKYYESFTGALLVNADWKGSGKNFTHYAYIVTKSLRIKGEWFLVGRFLFENGIYSSKQPWKLQEGASDVIFLTGPLAQKIPEWVK